MADGRLAPLCQGVARASGVLVFAATLVVPTSLFAQDAAAPRDLRRYAQEAIAAERTRGNAALADAMEGLLPQLLRDASLSRGGMGTAGLVSGRDPGVQRGLQDLADHMDARLGAAGQDEALASQRLGGFFTLSVKSEGVALLLTPSDNLALTTQAAAVTVDPSSGPADVQVDPPFESPGNSNNDTVGFSDKPGNGGGGGGGGQGNGKGK